MIRSEKDRNTTLQLLPDYNDEEGEDFVEVYGLQDWEISVPALAYFTQYGSSEFAVRPFIEARPEAMMQQMLAWSKHENHHIRRLSSEGCRPLLPWGRVLKDLKANPAPIFPILEVLKRML